MYERPDRWDRLLDDSLASYGEAPVRDGLEARILSRIDAGHQRRSAWWWMFAAVTTLAMILVVATYLPGRARKSPGQSAATLNRQLVVRPQPQRAPLLASGNTRPMRSRRSLSRRSRFPTVSPLTAEEQALLRFVKSRPRVVPPELTSLGAPVKPLEIAAVKLKPLTTKPLTEEK